MSSPANAPPIIIIKRKGGHGGHHGGAWKVAYADFVTAMMALFIVLWLLSSDEKVKKAVGGYFQDPTGSGKMTGSTMVGAGEGIMVDRDNMDKLKERLEQAMKELPKFDQMKNNVQVTVTPEGLRVELSENEGGMFFESGNAKPTAQGTELIRMLGEQLKVMPNKLLIEGYTDAKPYASEAGYTNWELSADRANRARRILQEAGVDGEQVAQVRGFADHRLKDPHNPHDPLNRRVSVLVQYREVPAAPVQAEAKGAAKGH
ncbi:MAG: OmpA family protein [Candidatus Solibacter usitatus]|nr:OmpA family protein [Candidatus Solibacter usitatus]